MDTNKWGRRPCENRSRDWSGASMSHGIPEARSNKGPPLLPSEREWPCRHLDVSETNILMERFMPHLVVSHNDFRQTSQLWKMVMGLQKAHVICPRKGQYKVHISSVNRLTPNPVIFPELLNQILVLVFALKKLLILLHIPVTFLSSDLPKKK